MRMEILISSVALAIVVLSLLAWKWRVKVRTSIYGGIVIGVLTGFLVSKIDSAFAWLNTAWLLPIEFIFILTIAFILILIRFYRDPERSPAETEKVIISPADGTVIYVNSVDKGSSLVSTKGKSRFKLDEITSTNLLAEAVCLVGIDMNVLNVHVNRSPIRGKVVFRKRTKGKFISLKRPESEIVNERVTTVIGNGMFRVGVIQISSRLVRSIVSLVNEGDNLDMGQRIGSIVFGSQVDVVIPKLENLKIEVKPGDEVKAGVSVLARYD
jgi:phosphatidylserine decarboxylase